MYKNIVLYELNHATEFLVLTCTRNKIENLHQRNTVKSELRDMARFRKSKQKHNIWMCQRRRSLRPHYRCSITIREPLQSTNLFNLFCLLHNLTTCIISSVLPFTVCTYLFVFSIRLLLPGTTVPQKMRTGTKQLHIEALNDIALHCAQNPDTDSTAKACPQMNKQNIAIRYLLIQIHILESQEY